MAKLYGDDPEAVKKAGALILNPTFAQHMMGLQPPGGGMEDQGGSPGIGFDQGSEEETPEDDLPFPPDGDLELE